MPALCGADLEYLAGARYGDHLEIVTWFSAVAGGLDAHHEVVRPGTRRPLVRASTHWRWHDPAGATESGLPGGLLAALHSLLAA